MIYCTILLWQCVNTILIQANELSLFHVFDFSSHSFFFFQKKEQKNMILKKKKKCLFWVWTWNLSELLVEINFFYWISSHINFYFFCKTYFVTELVINCWLNRVLFFIFCFLNSLFKKWNENSKTHDVYWKYNES